MCSANTTPKIMVFRPTWEEFQNFGSYIELMESKGAHRAGVAKVIPPPEWIPRKNSYDKDDIMSLKIPAPIKQVVKGKKGQYKQRNNVIKSMTVLQFKQLANSDEYQTPNHKNNDDLEKIYWENIVKHSPIYGADVSGSITDKDVDVWNMNKLGTVLDYINEENDIEGVNTPFIYIGMWKTTFAWHTEDSDLYSINYIHQGYPKTWYAIPPEHGRCFEKLMSKLFKSDASMCPAFLRHKSIIISPAILNKNNIPFNKVIQDAGEFMITFPFGYHAGFNNGFNIAESVNFASPRWVEYGKRASQCHCYQNSVNINMDIFVKHLQPERYKLWLEGNDIGPHPEDRPNTLLAPLSNKNAQRSKEKKHKGEPLKDIQGEVMEDTLLKNDEMEASEVSDTEKSRVFKKMKYTDKSIRKVIQISDTKIKIKASHKCFQLTLESTYTKDKEEKYAFDVWMDIVTTQTIIDIRQQTNS